MVKSIYPGTFDPVTNGHFDIIQRASYLFEELSVCVYSGSLKRSIFSVEERVEMIENTVSNLKNVNHDYFTFHTMLEVFGKMDGK